MTTEDKAHLGEGMQRIFDSESSLTPRSSRSSSRASSTSTSSTTSTSSRSSYSSGDRRRSVSQRSWKRHSHGSRYSSSSSSSSRSRSRSHPRCSRTSDRYRCSHRCRSRSCSPHPRRSSRYGRRRCSRSVSRSSSRERFCRRSGRSRSRSRSSSYGRAKVFYTGRFRCRFSPSPIRRYYRHRSKSPERNIRLSQRDKINLLNIAKENAAKILGVDAVKLPVSVRCVEEQAKRSDSEKSVRADTAAIKNPSERKGEADEDFKISRTSPARKPISFSVSNAIAKPSSSPTHHVTECKVTSRADSVGNRKPYGQWIPVRTVSTKKR